MRKNTFEKQADQRAVRFVKERVARGSLWHVPCSTRKRAGIDLQQDDDGHLYLTRTSPDGFVQGWRLSGADGKQLRVAVAHRPPRAFKP